MPILYVPPLTMDSGASGGGGFLRIFTVTSTSSATAVDANEPVVVVEVCIRCEDEVADDMDDDSRLSRMVLRALLAAAGGGSGL